MTKIAISCHPSIPLSADQLGDWLEHQVADLRALVPEATIRLSRLAQTLPSRDVDLGWLVEIELSQEEYGVVHERLVEAVRDMDLLGFQPTVLESVDVPDWSAAGNGHAAHTAREWW